jgi:hypothetical protein
MDDSMIFMLSSDNSWGVAFYRTTSPSAKTEGKQEVKDEHNNRHSSSSPEPENKKKQDASTKV